MLERDGRRLRLRLPGQAAHQPADPDERTLLSLLQHSPGLNVGETADRLAWSRRKVSYHAARLAGQGRLLLRPSGKTRRLFAPKDA